MRFLIILFCLFLRPVSAVEYFDCQKADGSISYRVSPCVKGETQLNNFRPDLSVYQAQESYSQAHQPIVLHPAQNGNYYINGAVNGVPLNFMVDTGASYLTLPLSLAQNFGASCQSVGIASTATGNVQYCMSTVSTLSVAGYEFHNVAVAFFPNSPPLLGQNVLSLFSVEQSGTVMKLSK